MLQGVGSQQQRKGPRVRFERGLLCLITCVGDDVFQGLAVEESADLFGSEAEGAVDELGG